MEHPITPQPPLQPVLAGLELDSVPAAPRAGGARQPVARKGRRRYWSIRDLSRRLWLGRGYDLLRELIHSGILPATRSAHSWWIDDADVNGLRLAFDDRAGKVRAFRNLEGWLRERCWVVPGTPQMASRSEGQTVFRWRGVAYLPQGLWAVEQTPSGETVYRHRPPGAPDAVPPLPVSRAA